MFLRAEFTSIPVRCFEVNSDVLSSVSYAGYRLQFTIMNQMGGERPIALLHECINGELMSYAKVAYIKKYNSK